MHEIDSPVTTDVDFEAPLKQQGFLRIPYSSNRSAYGQVMTPIFVISGRPGPTVLFTGGVHGDEAEGPITLMNVCRALDPTALRGRLIAVPAVNLPAIDAATRNCPIDGKNLNRVFPGSPTGSFTEILAHYIVTRLFPLADVVVDFHSGGSTLRYIPSLLVHRHNGDYSASLAAARAFGPPMIVISRDLETAGFLGNTAEAAGILTVTSELGGGEVTARTLRMATTGTLNLLRHVGLLDGAIVPPTAEGRSPTVIIEIESLAGYIVAEEDGLYEPFHALGTEIEAGTVVGAIHHTMRPFDAPRPCSSPLSGQIICVRPSAHVRTGDCLAIIGRVIERD